MIENCSFPSREKKTHPWKNPKKCPWKILTAREKFEKSVRESDFPIREKSRKKAKKCFHGHFWFSREKKKTLAEFDGTDGLDGPEKCPLIFFILCGYIDKVYTYLYTE